MTNQPKKIVLTGACRGLGFGMANALIAAGHTVFGCGRRPEGVEQMRSRYGSPHRFDVVDVSNDGQVSAWAKEILAICTPDLVINNAALINQNARLWEVPAEEFDRVIDVNVKGVTNVIRHFVPAMIERNAGVVVNFSSGWGRSTSPEVGPYCASKFAVEGLTKALAQELPDRMAAIPLSPGVVNTDMLHSCMGEAANNCSSVEDWAKDAVACILNLGIQHNGTSLTIQGHGGA